MKRHFHLLSRVHNFAVSVVAIFLIAICVLTAKVKDKNERFMVSRAL
jgi:hypothetical protein